MYAKYVTFVRVFYHQTEKIRKSPGRGVGGWVATCMSFTFGVKLNDRWRNMSWVIQENTILPHIFVILTLTDTGIHIHKYFWGVVEGGGGARQMLDQEKVTRVDFSLNAVRNTCIVSPRYGTYYRNLNQEKKNNEGLDEFAFVRWVAHVRAVNNLHACNFFQNQYDNQFSDLYSFLF